MVGTLPMVFLIGESNTAYTYDSAGKIFVYDPNNNNFSLVYDLSADSGYTWIVTWDTCSFDRMVYNTDSIMINGHTLKRTNGVMERIAGEKTLFHYLGEIYCKPHDSAIFETPFI
jgi:hypothetical protein